MNGRGFVKGRQSIGGAALAAASSPVLAALLATVLAALITACTLTPKYDRPAAPVSDAYPTGPAYKDIVASTTPSAGDIGWRTFFVDPRLQELVDIALRNNRDLRIAALTVEQVRAQYRLQRSALFPQLDANADLTRSRSPADLAAPGRGQQLSSRSLEASAAWELDFFGGLRSAKASAFEQYLASVQGRNAAQILLVSEVADQYLTLLAVDELLAVTQRTLDTAHASYDIVKLTFDTGTGTELDLRQAETVVEQANANRASQLRAQAQAENALVLLLGQPAPADLETRMTLQDQAILADVPAGLPSDLLTRRPDILQAEALLRSENADIGAARAAFFPRVTLTADGGTASSMLSGLFKAGSGAWDFAASLTQPIFNAGANRANLDIAKVRKQIGIAQYEQTIQTAFREVADGLAARGTFDDQIAALERFTNAERRRLELAQLLYKNGQASYLDVLTAQTDLYNAELTLVAARLERLTNLVDLYRALGGGWQER